MKQHPILPIPSPALNAAEVCASSPSSTIRRPLRRSCGTSSCGILPSARLRPAARGRWNPTRIFLPGRPEAGCSTRSTEASRAGGRGQSGRASHGGGLPSHRRQMGEEQLLLALWALSGPISHRSRGKRPLSLAGRDNSGRFSPQPVLSCPRPGKGNYYL